MLNHLVLPHLQSRPPSNRRHNVTTIRVKVHDVIQDISHSLLIDIPTIADIVLLLKPFSNDRTAADIYPMFVLTKRGSKLP
jgi:hypothetical protein